MHKLKNILRRWIFFTPIIACPILLVVCAAVSNPALTRYIESEKFREAMGMETAKGLHFVDGGYELIKRSGFLTASSDGFQGAGGRKAIVSMSASDITAKFNPLGIIRRRWQLDQVHIASGEVEIHTYEPTPEPLPAKPWYAIFLPDRVYLGQVICDTTDVTWQLRGEKSGFFGTRLLVTPHGRDFEYHASGGIMKMPVMPDLQLRGVHLLVTKEMLTLYNLDLAPGDQGNAAIHLDGGAGLKEDKSVDAEMTFSSIPITPWLPDSWRASVKGIASGNAHWAGKNTKLETSSGHGTLHIQHCRVSGLAFLQKLASLSGKKSLGTLDPEECSFNVEWNYPKIEFKEIVIEEHGKFRIDGSLSIDHGALGGSIQLGMAPGYLAWLPDAGKIFTRQEGGYLCTTVNFSGTIEKPKQDLGPRIAGMLEDNPGELFDYFLRQINAGFEKIFDDK